MVLQTLSLLSRRPFLMVPRCLSRFLSRSALYFPSVLRFRHLPLHPQSLSRYPEWIRPLLLPICLRSRAFSCPCQCRCRCRQYHADCHSGRYHTLHPVYLFTYSHFHQSYPACKNSRRPYNPLIFLTHSAPSAFFSWYETVTRLPKEIQLLSFSSNGLSGFL